MLLQRFKDWIEQQNSIKHFASSIRNGTTVYFRDDLAACYDLMIRGVSEGKRPIIIEFEKSFAGNDFIEVCINVWTQEADCELWYIGENLQWMVIANKNGRVKYGFADLIRSTILDFEFRLNQIP